jgi:hypothetical protein
MSYDLMPGANLEAPDTFQALFAPYWKRLPVAIGSTGGARWVAFYLNQGVVRYTDGANLGTGDTTLFWVYKRHPKIAPFFLGARLGSAETPASQWLVADTEHQVLYLASAEEARKHLAQQWLVYDGPPLDYTPDELARRLSTLEEISPEERQERVAEVQREARANHRLLLAWLDQQPDAPTSEGEPEEEGHASQEASQEGGSRDEGRFV